MGIVVYYVSDSDKGVAKLDLCTEFCLSLKKFRQNRLTVRIFAKLLKYNGCLFCAIFRKSDKTLICPRLSVTFQEKSTKLSTVSVG